MITSSNKIHVIEIDIKKWEEIKNHGGVPMAELTEMGYDILFGCTGYAAFHWNDRNKVNKDALLISVSSASVRINHRGSKPPHT